MKHQSIIAVIALSCLLLGGCATGYDDAHSSAPGGYYRGTRIIEYSDAPLLHSQDSAWLYGWPSYDPANGFYGSAYTGSTLYWRGAHPPRRPPNHDMRALPPHSHTGQERREMRPPPIRPEGSQTGPILQRPSQNGLHGRAREPR